MSVFRSRSVAVALIGCAGLALSGCARLASMSRADPLSIAVYPGGESRRDVPSGDNDCPFVRGVGSYGRGAIDLDCFRFPEDRGTTDDAHLAYSRAAETERDRNRLTALLLKHADDMCVEEMGRLTGNEALVNSALSIVGTTATTAANIVTGELAQSILAGVGTFAGATRSHVRADIYRNTFSYAVSRAITLERQRLRGLLEARYGDTLDILTVDDAIRAANEYHGVCSFYKGLELVLASVEGDQRSRDAQARREQIETIDQEIARQEQALSRLGPNDDRTPYLGILRDLNARRAALVLAGIPGPRPDDGDSDDDHGDGDGNGNGDDGGDAGGGADDDD